MTRAVNPFTIGPTDIQPGDVMMYVIKAMVQDDGSYRLYRCWYEGKEIPQGDYILDDTGAICKTIFPSLAVASEPDRR